MVNLKQLKAFKKKATKFGYESEGPKHQRKEADGSTTISFKLGDWKFHDNYFGGEPYGGRTLISYKNKPVWIMVYYGEVAKTEDAEAIYPFLRAALRSKKKEEGFRGPRKFSQEPFIYQNRWQGNLVKFSGREEIYKGRKQVYEAIYAGGLVDQRAGD